MSPDPEHLLASESLFLHHDQEFFYIFCALLSESHLAHFSGKLPLYAHLLAICR